MKHTLLTWTKVLAFILIFSSSLRAESVYTVTELKSIHKKILKSIKRCEKVHCSGIKLMKEFEKVVSQTIESERQKAELEQNVRTLESRALSLEKSSPLAPKQGCFKKTLLQEVMVDLGINESGNALYSKKPAGDGQSKCWANGKKKREATVVLCEFPLAINIMTKGGTVKLGSAETRTKEFLFSLNKCDLLSVRLSQTSHGKTKSTFLSLPTCLQEWNKRGTDSTMTKAQIQTMEETISQCFRYQILPASESAIFNLRELSGHKSGNTP